MTDPVSDAESLLCRLADIHAAGISERRLLGQASEWEPHPLDQWGQRSLIEIAHAANPPIFNSDWWSEVTLPAPHGWQVCFFYDCGELDYIDHFLTPDGERLEVWPNGYSSEQWPPVMTWRGPEDTDRLCAHQPPNERDADSDAAQRGKGGTYG